MVESRCAMTNAVRFFIKWSSASWIWRSVSESTEAVASSSNKDRRVLQQGPRDRQPLLLATREFHPALAHIGVQLLRQRPHKGIAACAASNAHNSSSPHRAWPAAGSPTVPLNKNGSCVT
jgi:hypothetical protein